MDDLQDIIVSFLQENDYSNAMTYLDEYELEYGRDYFFLISLSDIYLSLNQPFKVLPIMNEALLLKPNDVYIYERIADAYFYLGDYDHAILFYNKFPTNQDDRENLQILHMLGLCNFKKGSYKEAIQYFEDVLLDEYRDDTLLYCSFSYYFIGKINRCFEYIDGYMNNGMPESRDLLLEFMVDSRMDICSFNRFLDKFFEGESDFQHSLRSVFYQNKSNDDLAISELQSISLEKQDLNFFYTLAFLYLENDNLDCANDLFERIWETSQFDVESCKLQCLLIPYLNISKQDIIEKLKSYISKFPEDASIFFYVFSAAVSNKFYDFCSELILLFDSYKYSNFEEEISNIRIQYYLEAGLYNEGIKYLRGLKDIDHDDLFYHNLIVFYYFLCQYDKVLEYASFAMPDGVIAYMAHDSALHLKMFDIANEIVDYISREKELYHFFPHEEVFEEYMCCIL